MSKVHVLATSTDTPHHNKQIFGVITNPDTAKKWRDLSDLQNVNFSVECELDDPELLNRIAKKNKPKEKFGAVRRGIDVA